MRARSTSDVTSLRQAYALLGLTGPADAEVVTAAFRTTIKAARPDVAGGDAERFRRAIAAWRLIQKQAAPLALAAPTRRAPAPPVLGITPAQALAGGGCHPFVSPVVTCASVFRQASAPASICA